MSSDDCLVVTLCEGVHRYGVFHRMGEGGAPYLREHAIFVSRSPSEAILRAHILNADERKTEYGVHIRRVALIAALKELEGAGIA